jgi:hypothetical protein
MTALKGIRCVLLQALLMTPAKLVCSKAIRKSRNPIFDRLALLAGFGESVDSKRQQASQENGVRTLEHTGMDKKGIFHRF